LLKQKAVKRGALSDDFETEVLEDLQFNIVRGFYSAGKNIRVKDQVKPDLIVNSAGQDNHYSDPITSMNFSARGYADLTTLLKSDIAVVLEGGYSI